MTSNVLAQNYLGSFAENEPITSYPTGLSYQTGPGGNNSVKQWTYPYGIKLSLHQNVSRNFEIMTTDKDGKLAFRQFNQHTNNWTSWKILLDNSGGYLNINNDGTVGVNTTDTKGHTLAVNGDIIAEEVLVASYNDWPDYVFANDYKLKSLEELEQFIQVNNHLPNIPDASEIKENGISLGEMDAKLLEKIEELTLYVIQLKKELEESNRMIQELQRR